MDYAIYTHTPYAAIWGIFHKESRLTPWLLNYLILLGLTQGPPGSSKQWVTFTAKKHQVPILNSIFFLIGRKTAAQPKKYTGAEGGFAPETP